MRDFHTISLAGGKHNWDKVEERMKELQLSSKSEYVQQLVDKDINMSHNRWKYNLRIVEIVTLILLAMICLLLIMR